MVRLLAIDLSRNSEFGGDTLMICMGNAGEARPADLSPSGREWVAHSSLRRGIQPEEITPITRMVAPSSRPLRRDLSLDRRGMRLAAS
jgi:hypothetical protein